MSFSNFTSQFTDFRVVEDWVLRHKVILVIDELNAIPPEASGYQKMSRFLDTLVGRKGSALIYSTHLRDTSDLLRKRLAGESGWLFLREHKWLMIPRIVNENCLRGLRRETASQPSFWCAVLRGRLTALFLQSQDVVIGPIRLRIKNG